MRKKLESNTFITSTLVPVTNPNSKTFDAPKNRRPASSTTTTLQNQKTNKNTLHYLFTTLIGRRRPSTDTEKRLVYSTTQKYLEPGHYLTIFIVQ